MTQSAITIPVYKFNPLQDDRWGSFLKRHPRASVFHSVPWLEVLYRTYQYEPVVYTSSAPGEELKDGIVLGEVNSWLTGRRSVSLPFSDHCEPLVSDPEVTSALFAAMVEDSKKLHWKYVELRPREEMAGRAGLFEPVQTYYHHDLNLGPNLDSIYSGFHKNCVQRKIRRAEHEGLLYVEGRAKSLIDHFYRLLLLTRQRHQVPPQPKKWFLNLADSFGDALKVRLVYSKSVPVAGILTLQFRDVLTYKFGCSDENFHKLGGMHLLFWKSIQEAKQRGLQTFDLGRSETTNEGLITFKDRWGATRSTVSYYSYLNPRIYSAKNHSSQTRRKLIFAKRVFKHLPANWLSSVGNLLYRHVG
jgi:CelD/BcsL family acetyltransferase involved in cellulose biosynthesis